MQCLWTYKRSTHRSLPGTVQALLVNIDNDCFDTMTKTYNNMHIIAIFQICWTYPIPKLFRRTSVVLKIVSTKETNIYIARLNCAHCQ